jgi:hypothetical protein
MTVTDSALTVEGHEGLGFCSEHCRETFRADPERYLGDAEGDSDEEDS